MMDRGDVARAPAGLTVITDSRSSYADILDDLAVHHGAEIVTLDPSHDGVRVLSKWGLIARLVRPSVLRAVRSASRRETSLIVFGWYALPVLALQRLHLAPRPRSMVFVALFVHDRRIQRIVFRLLRLLGSARWRGVAFSEADRAALVDAGVFADGQVAHVVYRRPDDLEPPAEGLVGADPADPPYVFTAGFSHRDYVTFSAAVADAPWPVRMVVSESALDDVTVGPNVEVEVDVPWDRYEHLLSRAAVVVIPLLPGGGACGQSVMLSAMKHARPVIVSANPSVEAYVGVDYPGLVQSSDPVALRAALDRAMSDEGFTTDLVDRVVEARRSLCELASMGDEIAALATA